MISIVFCHPSARSYNHALLQAITDKLTDEGREYYVINLYAEGFNPVLDSQSLEHYAAGQTDDEMVRRYQQALTHSDTLIFIFPVWWGMMPAMLKGWIDKVFLKSVVYDTTPEGSILPCLSISNTTIITTSEEDSAIIAPFIEGYFTPLVLNAVGINGVRWFNCDHVSTIPQARRDEFTAAVLAHIVK